MSGRPNSRYSQFHGLSDEEVQRLLDFWTSLVAAAERELAARTSKKEEEVTA